MTPRRQSRQRRDDRDVDWILTSLLRDVMRTARDISVTSPRCFPEQHNLTLRNCFDIHNQVAQTCRH
jgi:hypothetical protein